MATEIWNPGQNQELQNEHEAVLYETENLRKEAKKILGLIKKHRWENSQEYKKALENYTNFEQRFLKIREKRKQEITTEVKNELLDLKKILWDIKDVRTRTEQIKDNLWYYTPKALKDIVFSSRLFQSWLEWIRSKEEFLSFLKEKANNVTDEVKSSDLQKFIQEIEVSGEVSEFTKLRATYVLRETYWPKQRWQNLEQEMYIKKILWVESLEKWYGNNFIHWFSEEKWNFVMSIQDFERELKNNSFDIKNINSLALANYLLYLKNNQNTTPEDIRNAIGIKRISDLVALWKREWSTIAYDHMKRNGEEKFLKIFLWKTGKNFFWNARKFELQKIKTKDTLEKVRNIKTISEEILQQESVWKLLERLESTKNITTWIRAYKEIIKKGVNAKDIKFTQCSPSLRISPDFINSLEHPLDMNDIHHIEFQKIPEKNMTPLITSLFEKIERKDELFQVLYSIDTKKAKKIVEKFLETTGKKMWDIVQYLPTNIKKEKDEIWELDVQTTLESLIENNDILNKQLDNGESLEPVKNSYLKKVSTYIKEYGITEKIQPLLPQVISTHWADLLAGSLFPTIMEVQWEEPKFRDIVVALIQKNPSYIKDFPLIIRQDEVVIDALLTHDTAIYFLQYVYFEKNINVCRKIYDFAQKTGNLYHIFLQPSILSSSRKLIQGYKWYRVSAEDKKMIETLKQLIWGINGEWEKISQAVKIFSELWQENIKIVREILHSPSIKLKVWEDGKILDDKAVELWKEKVLEQISQAVKNEYHIDSISRIIYTNFEEASAKKLIETILVELKSISKQKSIETEKKYVKRKMQDEKKSLQDAEKDLQDFKEKVTTIISKIDIKKLQEVQEQDFEMYLPIIWKADIPQAEKMSFIQNIALLKTIIQKVESQEWRKLSNEEINSIYKKIEQSEIQYKINKIDDYIKVIQDPEKLKEFNHQGIIAFIESKGEIQPVYTESENQIWVWENEKAIEKKWWNLFFSFPGSGEKVEITPQEAMILQNSQEAKNNFMKFYLSLKIAWIENLWKHREWIFWWIKSKYPNFFTSDNTDFLNEQEQRIFFISIFKALKPGIEKDYEWILSIPNNIENLSLEKIMQIFNSIQRKHIHVKSERQENIFEEQFRKLYFEGQMMWHRLLKEKFRDIM